MPTEKPRFTITVSEDMLKQIDDFKFANRFKTQNQAVIALVAKGIEELERRSGEQMKKTPGFDAAKPEDEVNSKIQLFAQTLERAGVIAPGEDLSSADVDFLFAMFMAMKAHFDKTDKGGE